MPLMYFSTGITNGRTEGYNNKAKVVKRRSYGFRSFLNYRLRLLNAVVESVLDATHSRSSRTVEP